VVGAWVSVIIGAIFVVCVMIFRRGFVGNRAAPSGTAKHKLKLVERVS